MLNGASTPNRTEICMIKVGADGEIRTHDELTLPDYKSGPINRYGTSALNYKSMAPRSGIEPAMPFGDGLTVRSITAMVTSELKLILLSI